MGTMDNLVHATMIHTNGLMRGSWNRVASETSFDHIFQSWTHPNLKLKFTKAYLLEIQNENEEPSYTYFWNPVEGYLTESTPSEENKKLSVELVVTEVQDDESNEILEECRREKNKSQTKIDDLTKQLHSMQLICNVQEKSLKYLLNEPGVKYLKNASVNKCPLLHPVSNRDTYQRPVWAPELRAHYEPSNPDRDLSTPNSFDNTVQLGWDFNRGPSLALGPLQYGMNVVPVREYDPYCQSISLPVFNQPMHYPYSVYDHYGEGHYGTCPYPNFPIVPPPPITEPSGMGLPQRVSEHIPMANHGALVHQLAAVHQSDTGENAKSIAENRSSFRDCLEAHKNGSRAISSSKSSSLEFRMKQEHSIEPKDTSENPNKAVVHRNDQARNANPRNANPGNILQTSDSVGKANSHTPQVQPRAIRSEKNGIGLIMGPHDPSGDKMLREFRRQSRLQ